MTTIPLLDLTREYESMKEEIDGAIKKCLDHQKWILGPEVQELEEKVALYLGAAHCVGTSSGTDALVLAIRALAIKTKGQEYFDRGDLIITTPFTFTATGDAILRAGATPFFVDIDPGTFNIDPARIRAALSDKPPAGSGPPRFVGLLPVHLYGQVCRMDEIMALAEEYGLFVVEDVAQAMGASFGTKKAGSMGDAGAFSFFPSKNLGGFGDGGMVSTKDPEIAGLLRMLLKHGGKDKYNVDHIGYNARLDTLQAAILLAKLTHLDHFNAHRRRIAEVYCEGLRGLEGIVLPLASDFMAASGDPTVHGGPPAAYGHVFHQFTLRVTSGRRNALQQHLREAAIDSAVYYPLPLHRMGVFKEGRSRMRGDLVEADRAVGEVLSLPIEPLMTEEEQNRITGAIGGFWH